MIKSFSDLKANAICAFATIALLCLSTSCSKPQERLAARVDEISASYPAKIADGLDVKSIEYDGENLIYTYAVDEDYFDVSLIADNLNPVTIEQVLSESFNGDDSKLVANAKAGIICVFLGSYGNECKVKIDPAAKTATVLQ